MMTGTLNRKGSCLSATLPATRHTWASLGVKMLLRSNKLAFSPLHHRFVRLFACSLCSDVFQ